MNRPRRADILAALVGLAAVSWTAMLTNPAGRLLAVAAALAVITAVVWRAAATLAGCLLVAAIAVPSPDRLDPAGLALAAALLTGYLVLVDTHPARPAGVLVPAGAVVAAIAAVTLAAELPSRAWMAPVGMACAATALILTVRALHGSRSDRP